MGIQIPYDDVFRTLLNDSPRLIIPVVNVIFGTAYDLQDPVVLYNNEFYAWAQDGRQEEKITDSYFSIRGDKYHLECQSTIDGTIVIRIFDYDVLIAIREGERTENGYRVSFPKSALIYLRSNPCTPNEEHIHIRLPEGEDVSYTVPILKIQAWSVEEIFDQELYFLIPFLIFRYEDDLKACEREETGRREQLLHTFREVRYRLDDLCRCGFLIEYEKRQLIDLSKKVMEHLLKNYPRTRKEIVKVMGGEILEYEAKTIRNQGIAKGKEEGKAEGIKEGKAEGIKEGKVEDQKLVFHLMLERGYTMEEAQVISRLSDEQIRALRESR